MPEAAAPTAFQPCQVVVAGRPYTYKAPAAIDLKPRDLVVVEFGSKGFVVGVVESLNEIPLDPQAKFQYKWIVARVDTYAYDQLKATDAATAPAVDPLAKFR